MSAALRLVDPAPAAAGEHEDELDIRTRTLLEAVTAEFAATVQWDVELRHITFPQEHPTLGWKMCSIEGCGLRSTHADGLCATCRSRWRRLGSSNLEEFRATPKEHARVVGVRPCVVEDCRRPWKSATAKLCLAHDVQQRSLGVDLASFLALPSVVGHPSAGPCLVAACIRDRAGIGPYCVAHYNRWRLARQRDPGLEEEFWQRTSPAIAEGNVVSLRGLRLQVAAEFVYGLQERSRAGAGTPFNFVRPLINLARLRQVASLADLPVDGAMNRFTRGLRNDIVKRAELLFASPETERAKDRWNLTVFGHGGGSIRFDKISQPWLAAMAKAWAFDALPRLRGRGLAGRVQAQIDGIVRLSESLRLQREDDGLDPRALGRGDITAYCNRLAFLAERGDISAWIHYRCCNDVRRLLGRARRLGLTLPGGPLHGLPQDFALGPEDLPDLPEDQEAGRDLPLEVVRFLCEHLDTVARDGAPEVRAAVELMIDTGRRPDEICRLAYDCLVRDALGKPVLVYDNTKANRLGRRLPIAEATASVIVEQQERARARFPEAPIGELKLLPSYVSNPSGARPIKANSVSARHRKWVDGLPEITVPTLIEVEGRTVTKMLPFDKSKIFLYAYRHTFAQRHADAGVRSDALRELMDHRSLMTTQRYYNVGEERRREAVDRVTSMQFDRHGDRIWRRAQTLMDAEHARLAVGEIAVPYGICTEPANVAAAGQDCPVRFRCVGCSHFRTDVSYLPDLEAYLADLLRNREQLLATVDADEWAKAEAMPSDEEVSRVRRLISRIKSALGDLDEEDRRQIQQAVTTMRRARTGVTHLGLPSIRQPLPDTRTDRAA